MEDFKANEKPIKGCAFDVRGCLVEEDDSEEAKIKYGENQFFFRLKLWNKDDAKFDDREMALLVDSREERTGWINVLKLCSQSNEEDAKRRSDNE